MIVVNFFGAPGAGKTAAALGVASYLKRQQENAEYVSEFAKDQVWAEAAHLLEHQNWVFANQEMRLRLLLTKVDWVATDSPLPLSAFYSPAHYPPAFAELCFHFFGQYRNVNFFLRRTHPYRETGRLQTEVEADELEARMKAFLASRGVAFHEIDASDASPEAVVALLRSGELAGT